MCFVCPRHLLLLIAVVALRFSSSAPLLARLRRYIPQAIIPYLSVNQKLWSAELRQVSQTLKRTRRNCEKKPKRKHTTPRLARDQKKQRTQHQGKAACSARPTALSWLPHNRGKSDRAARMQKGHSAVCSYVRSAARCQPCLMCLMQIVSLVLPVAVLCVRVCACAVCACSAGVGDVREFRHRHRQPEPVAC